MLRTQKNFVPQAPGETSFVSVTFLARFGKADIRVTRSIRQIGFKADLRRRSDLGWLVGRAIDVYGPELPFTGRLRPTIKLPFVRRAALNVPTTSGMRRSYSKVGVGSVIDLLTAFLTGSSWEFPV